MSTSAMPSVMSARIKDTIWASTRSLASAIPDDASLKQFCFPFSMVTPVKANTSANTCTASCV